MTAQAKPSADDAFVLSRLEAGVLTLTLNRPAQRNPLSTGMMASLQQALERARDDPAVRVVVLAGAGPAFSAGHDLRELKENPEERFYQAVFQQCSRLMLTITRLPKPVVAMVHGVATAAGCQLVATADLAVASEAARFATPGVNIGLFCSTPMVALSRAVGRKPAMEMLLTGQLIDAATARELGLVNRVVPAAALERATQDLAAEIAGKSPLVLEIGKEAFYRQLELGLEQAYAYASEVMTRNMLAADASEGIDAFLAKRPPKWCGR
jgi:enoyl-CoA hydratase/carnithine racemase